MDATPVDEMGAIQRIGELLLSTVYGRRAVGRVVKRNAVRLLMAPIMAARDAGLTYEEIARHFGQGGLALEAQTLRKYLGEAKSQDELAKDARRHADQVAKARRLIEMRQAAAIFEAAECVGRERTTATSAANSSAPNTRSLVRAADDVESRLPVAKATDRLIQSAQAPSPAVRKPVGNGSAKAVVPGAREQEPAPSPTALPSSESVQLREGMATSSHPRRLADSPRTIDEIERDSTTIDQRSELEQDIEVRDGKVFTTDGRPYSGLLTRKQLYLLRQMGKLMAPVVGQSSKAFVRMPERL